MLSKIHLCIDILWSEEGGSKFPLLRKSILLTDKIGLWFRQPASRRRLLLTSYLVSTYERKCRQSSGGEKGEVGRGG